MKNAADFDQTLSPGVDADLPTLLTARALQRHQTWVSDDASKIPKLVQRAGFKLVRDVITPARTGGQAYIAQRGDQVVIAFRGSTGDNLAETLLNVLVDSKIRRVPPEKILKSDGEPEPMVHEGFYENYLEFRDEIRGAIRDLRDKEFYVTGFSLGSALATLCALDLTLNEGCRVTLHGMGTPRVGNAAFARCVAHHVPRTLRTVLTSDPISRVPPQLATPRGFQHTGALMELEEDGSPVPLEKINGRLIDRTRLGDHDTGKYAAMIQGLIDRFAQDPPLLVRRWGKAPLQTAAERERAVRGKERSEAPHPYPPDGVAPEAPAPKAAKPKAAKPKASKPTAAKPKTSAPKPTKPKAAKKGSGAQLAAGGPPSSKS